MEQPIYNDRTSSSRETASQKKDTAPSFVKEGVKFTFQQFSRKGLQTIWNNAKIGIKKGTTVLLVKAGLHTIAATLSAGVGNVVIFVAPKVLKIGTSLIKSTIGFFTNFSALITGQKEVEEDKSLAFLFPLLGGLALVVFLMPVLFIVNILGGAFIAPSPLPSTTRYIGPFPPEVIHPVCVEGQNSLPNFLCKISQDYCVPPSILIAISKTEAGSIWSFSCDEINNFSQENWWESANWTTKCRGYCYNTCNPETEVRKPESQGGCGITWDFDCGSCKKRETTVYGPMQFEECTWEELMPGYTTMDRCRLDISFIAAAIKIKGASGTGEQCDNWSKETVRQVAKNYCGSCGTGLYNEETGKWEGGCWDNPPGWKDSCDPSCGVDYCGSVWYHYQQYANQ